MEIRILEETCTGCELCIPSCPFGALTMEDRLPGAPPPPPDSVTAKVARVWESCVDCDLCLPVCPPVAILHDRPEGTAAVPSTPGSGILVAGDLGPTGLRPSTRRVLRRARELANTLGCFLTCLLTPRVDPGTACKDAIACGADRVLLVDATDTNPEDGLGLPALLAPILAKEQPEIVLFPDSIRAAALAPRLAERLGAGLASPCHEVDLDLSTRQLLQRVPLFKGLGLGELVCAATRPQMAVLRTHQLPDPMPDGSRDGEIVQWNLRAEI
ncbi:MAG: 4Fe-4S binding protein [Planctomycetes bacterium]|nr:4Fe-4S binding protein [Planctomycetota bacterium]